MVGKVTPNTKASASRLPAIMGLSKYRSPNDELGYSIDAYRGIEPPPLSDPEPASWGDKLEDMILKEACLRIGIPNLDLDHPTAYHHPSWPLCCSLDGMADGRRLMVEHDPDNGVYVIGRESLELIGKGVLEAKLTSMEPEDMPPLWRGPVQLQGQMACVNANWGIVATLYRGTKLRVFVFERHDLTWEAIRVAVEDFQRRLDIWQKDGTVEYFPPQDSKDADRTWPMADDEVELEELGAEAEALCKMIQMAKSNISGFEEQINDCEKKLKELMREAPKAKAGPFQIKWPMRHYKAQPERVVPAKEGYSVRQSTLSIKESSHA
jgi:predicted phage-related endonuclease